mmetsp:Transcript_103907/g.180556  ORF Transcript_103907/g.180556 Transcript_103907/m.180556 type:complete len:83 (+) Transcript_103907:1448-1696(+)
MSEAKIEASAPMRGDTILGAVACDERAEDSIPTVKEDMPFDTMHDTSAGMLCDMILGDAAADKAVRAFIPARDKGTVLGFTK